MSQATITQSDQSGYSYVQNMNNVMKAIATDFSGDSPPPEIFPGMKWLNTSTNPAVLYRRDADNLQWVIESTGGGGGGGGGDGDSSPVLPEIIFTVGTGFTPGGRTISLPEGVFADGSKFMVMFDSAFQSTNSYTFDPGTSVVTFVTNIPLGVNQISVLSRG